MKTLIEKVGFVTEPDGFVLPFIKLEEPIPGTGIDQVKIPYEDRALAVEGAQIIVDTKSGVCSLSISKVDPKNGNAVVRPSVCPVCGSPVYAYRCYSKDCEVQLASNMLFFKRLLVKESIDRSIMENFSMLSTAHMKFSTFIFSINGYDVGLPPDIAKNITCRGKSDSKFFIDDIIKFFVMPEEIDLTETFELLSAGVTQLSSLLRLNEFTISNNCSQNISYIFNTLKNVMTIPANRDVVAAMLTVYGDATLV